MRKQIHPIINGHFLRSVLIVFSLVAVCVIAIALAQQTNNLRQLAPRYSSRSPLGVVNPTGVSGQVAARLLSDPETTPNSTASSMR
jgi:hypothetical protein